MEKEKTQNKFVRTYYIGQGLTHMLRRTLLIFQQVQDQEMDIQRKIVEQGF
jgi:hypothetical protein